MTRATERTLMTTTKVKLQVFPARRRAWLVASAVSALLLGTHAQWSRAEGPATKTFSSAAEASEALFRAVHDDDAAALDAILGREITSSGAESEDKLERQRFDEKYREMHRLVSEVDGSTVLYVGAENWPFPVPLVSENGQWRFDTDAGMEEVARRKVGHDEMTAARVCQHALRGTAKGDATRRASDDPIIAYAEGLLATGPVDAGRTAGAEAFHGYFFRLVPKHPANGGKTEGGLAVVAYPAEYRSSGVMTFIVTKQGSVYEKDLGPETATVAPKTTDRSGPGWHAVRMEPAT